MRYIITDEHIYELLRLAIQYTREEIELNERGKNERFIPARDAVNDWQREMRSRPVPDWATHFAQEKNDDDQKDQDWYELKRVEEIPK